MTVNHFFGTPSLTSTETPPFSTWSMVNPIVLDKSPIWSDDQVAIMTADVPAKCYTGLKSVMDLLPPLDESMGKCGEHFSGFNWEMFREAFEHFMLDEERSDDWPSFSEIFMANFKNDSAALDGTWRSTFSTFTCAQWNALPLSMIQSPVFVPVLNAEGPNVNSPFDLINLALKLALSNPKLQTQIDDVAIKAISEVCLACAVVADISYDRLFRSVDVGSNSGPCVKGALLGGQGGTVASYLDSLAREVPQGPVAGTPTSTSQGDKDGTVAAVEIVRPDSVQASYFERCLIGTTLQFNISLENATVSIPEAKGFLGQIKHRLAPLSSFAPGQQLLVISGAIDSKQSIDITTISTKVSVDGKVATVTLPVVRNFLGWLQFTLNATYGNATLTTLLTKPLVCGFVTAVAQSSLAQTTSRSVNIRQPSSNTLSDLFRAEVIEIMTFEFDIDIRFHGGLLNAAEPSVTDQTAL
ncbi:hypothetical protein DFJ73DRAFT_5092 [Zopfochytrium polystomum]|nr:hypothetical protein DFJ73DRAFT_5092 [Zopfochytrium polystomum]